MSCLPGVQHSVSLMSDGFQKCELRNVVGHRHITGKEQSGQQLWEACWVSAEWRCALGSGLRAFQVLFMCFQQPHGGCAVSHVTGRRIDTRA